jgi:SAM-dependent methyltransferase
LAVADGEGRNSVWLARQGLQVDAFDLSQVGVAKARALAQQSGVDVNYAVADCDGWQWPTAVYDYVVAIFVQFADPAARARLFSNMVRALKPGGYLLLQGYTPKQLDYKTGGPGIPEHLYTPALLRQELPGVRIVELREYEEELAEGARHNGMSALVGLVGQK